MLLRAAGRWGWLAGVLLTAARAWAQPATARQAERGAPTAAENRETTAAEAPQYVRVRREDGTGRALALETALARFVPGEKSPAEALPKGLEVTLIGAVHIGDRAYYQALNQEFERYEAVLYELVAPAGTRVPQGGPEGDTHPVRLLQDGLRTMLGLESQLEWIDYQRANLVHADLSPEEFEAAMQDRGESVWTLAFRMFGQNLLDQATRPEQAADEAELITAMLSGDRAMFRRALASQFENVEAMLDAVSGPEGSALITDRNRRAVEELERQIARGRRRLAVFYGAGHLPDLAEQLAVLGLVPDETRWLVAWDLSEPVDQEPRDEPPAEGGSAPPRRTEPRQPPAAEADEPLIFQESDI